MKTLQASRGRAARAARRLVSMVSVGSLLLGGLAAVAIVLPAAAQAEVTPQVRAQRIAIEASQGKQVQSQLTVRPLAELGEVCNTNRAADVWETGTLKVLYEVGDNTPMRIENYAGTYYYIAHADGKPNGEIERAAINQSTCHKT
jgi:hypothetical protein